MSEVVVKERGMLFSGPMVRALLAGTKTQTRRALSDRLIINDEPGRYKFHGMGGEDFGQPHGALFEDLRPEITPWLDPIRSPYGQPGDRLWVRETIYAHPAFSSADAKAGLCGDLFTDTGEICAFRGYVADGEYTKPFKQIPAIHMPRAASRLLLEITAVRCERVKGISREDAIAEGVESVGGGRYWLGAPGLTPQGGPERAYRTLWQSINGPEWWAANPWVWVVTFRVISPTA